MLREQAEHEAQRLNRQDPRRGRLEFYAFDESAGLAEDAWDIATRLSEGPPPETPAARAAAGVPVDAEPESAPSAPADPETARVDPAAEPPVYLQGPTVAQTDPFSTPDPFGEPSAFAEEWAVEADEPKPRPHMAVRLLGAVVIVVGMLWMAMVVALAVILKPNDLTGFAVYIGAAVLGLLAILLGVAIRRP